VSPFDCLGAEGWGAGAGVGGEELRRGDRWRFRPERKAREDRHEGESRGRNGNEVPGKAAEAGDILDDPTGPEGLLGSRRGSGAGKDHHSRIAFLIEKQVLEIVEMVMRRRGDGEEEEDEVDSRGSPAPAPLHGRHYTLAQFETWENGCSKER
jgi:hypothetical protein